MSTTAFFGMLAGVLALLEIYPYVLSILGRGLLLQKIPEEERTVPNLATWTILSMEVGIVAFSYYERNDMDEFWFFAGFFLECLITAILSLRYGEHRRTRGPIFSALDKTCLAGAGAGLVAWYLSGSWGIPIALIIIIEGCGLAPTVEKVWRLPRSEDLRAWTMTVLAYMFSILALGPIDTWNFERSAVPICTGFMAGLIWALILRRFGRK